MATPARTETLARPGRFAPAPVRAWLTEERVAWLALGLAIAISASLLLVMGRDTTFFNLDELTLYSTDEWDADVLFSPWAGQLIVFARVVFKLVLDVVGAEYAVFRVIGAAAAIAPAVMLFLVARRWIGPTAALAPAVLLLFFGSGWNHMMWPTYEALSAGTSLAAGLGAVLALDSGGRRNEVIACVLLVISTSAFAIGVAFAIGIGVWILLRPDMRPAPWRHAWISLIPLALYAVWWVWALKFQQHAASEANVLLIPSYFAQQFFATMAAIAGLNFDFAGGETVELDASWGPPLALLALGALALVLRRGSIPPILWGALAVLACYWLAGALVVDPPPGWRGPAQSRYLYPSAVLIFLVAVAAAAGTRPSRNVLIALFAAVAVALPANIKHFADAGNNLGSHSDTARAQFGVLELARPHGVEDFNPGGDTPEVSPSQLLFGADGYFRGADAYGSIAFSIPELLEQDEEVRHGADVVLASALDLNLVPSNGAEERSGCRGLSPAPSGDPVTAELPRGGAVFTAEDDTAIAIRRFADSTTNEVGELPAGRPMKLRIPEDSAPRPWVASLETFGPVRVCGIAS